MKAAFPINPAGVKMTAISWVAIRRLFVLAALVRFRLRHQHLRMKRCGARIPSGDNTTVSLFVSGGRDARGASLGGGVNAPRRGGARGAAIMLAAFATVVRHRDIAFGAPLIVFNFAGNFGLGRWGNDVANETTLVVKRAFATHCTRTWRLSSRDFCLAGTSHVLR